MDSKAKYIIAIVVVLVLLVVGIGAYGAQQKSPAAAAAPSNGIGPAAAAPSNGIILPSAGGGSALVPVPGVYATAMGDGCGAAGTRVKVTIPSDNIAGATGPAAAGLTFCAGVAGKHVEDSNTYMSFAPTCPAGTQKVGELPGASPPLDVCAGPPSVIGQWPFTLFANEVKCPSGAPPVGTIPFSVMEGPGGGGRAGWFGATLCK